MYQYVNIYRTWSEIYNKQTHRTKHNLNELLGTDCSIKMNNALLAKQSKKVIQTIFKTRAQLLFSSQATITDTNVEVQIGDHLEKFPVIWLKDNCTCQECTFTTRSRLINWNQFNLDSTVKELKVRPSKLLGKLLVFDFVDWKWSDQNKVGRRARICL